MNLEDCANFADFTRDQTFTKQSSRAGHATDDPSIKRFLFEINMSVSFVIRKNGSQLSSLLSRNCISLPPTTQTKNQTPHKTKATIAPVKAAPNAIDPETVDAPDAAGAGAEEPPPGDDPGPETPGVAGGAEVGANTGVVTVGADAGTGADAGAVDTGAVAGTGADVGGVEIGADGGADGGVSVGGAAIGGTDTPGGMAMGGSGGADKPGGTERPGGTAVGNGGAANAGHWEVSTGTLQSRGNPSALVLFTVGLTFICEITWHRHVGLIAFTLLIPAQHPALGVGSGPVTNDKHGVNELIVAVQSA
jgi:hypothetical protein